MHTLEKFYIVTFNDEMVTMASGNYVFFKQSSALRSICYDMRVRARMYRNSSFEEQLATGRLMPNPDRTDIYRYVMQLPSGIQYFKSIGAARDAALAEGVLKVIEITKENLK